MFNAFFSFFTETAKNVNRQSPLFVTAMITISNMNAQFLKMTNTPTAGHVMTIYT